MKNATIEEVRAVRPRAEDMVHLIAPDAAIGIGVFGDGFGLSVIVSADSIAKIPSEIDGIPIKVRRTGPIVAEISS